MVEVLGEYKDIPSVRNGGEVFQRFLAECGGIVLFQVPNVDEVFLSCRMWMTFFVLGAECG